MTKVLGALAIAVALLALHSNDGLAQIGRLGGNPDRAALVQRIERQFQERLARELELSEDQREELTEVLRDYATARSELLPRRRAIGLEIRELLEGDQSEDRALELIQDLREIRREEADLLEEEEDRLLDVLSPIQVLRLQALRDQFGEQIRGLGTPSQGRGAPPRRFFRFQVIPGF
jgi:hypothetical protein